MPFNSPSPFGERVRVRGDKIKRTNIEKCRRLRSNQTEAEKKLWSILRNRQLGGIKFRRQFSIGNYILDFYAPEYGVGVEADGGQHYDARGIDRDEIRKRELSKIGVDLLRFGDHEILTNISGVCEAIQEALKKKPDTPSPQSSPRWVEEVRRKK